jgi:hypothetical protein
MANFWNFYFGSEKPISPDSRRWLQSSESLPKRGRERNDLADACRWSKGTSRTNCGRSECLSGRTVA